MGIDPHFRSKRCSARGLSEPHVKQRDPALKHFLLLRRSGIAVTRQANALSICPSEASGFLFSRYGEHGEHSVQLLVQQPLMAVNSDGARSWPSD
jgi:hypothetical protein